MTTKTILIVFSMVVVVAIIAVIFTAQAGNFASTKIAAEVVIPANAFVAPEGWKSGYVFDDKFYAPNTIAIKAGESVRWTNKDSGAHTVTSQKVPDRANAFDSRLVDPGKTVVFTFRVAGEYEYFCTLHPYMGGKTQVLP